MEYEVIFTYSILVDSKNEDTAIEEAEKELYEFDTPRDIDFSVDVEEYE